MVPRTVPRRNTLNNVLSGCDNVVGSGQDAVVCHKLLKPGVSNGSTKLWVAPLSTSIVRVKSPEQRLAADRATFIAMKAPKPHQASGGSAAMAPKERVLVR